MIALKEPLCTITSYELFDIESGESITEWLNNESANPTPVVSISNTDKPAETQISIGTVEGFENKFMLRAN
jgi:hypothetical protein